MVSVRSGLICHLKLFLALTTTGVFLHFSGTAQAQGRRPPVVRERILDGNSYVSLDDVAESINGRLHWYPVSRRVDLSFRSHDVQFYPGSTAVVVDGRPAPQVAPTVKNRGELSAPERCFRSAPLALDFNRRIEWRP